MCERSCVCVVCVRERERERDVCDLKKVFCFPSKIFFFPFFLTFVHCVLVSFLAFFPLWSSPDMYSFPFRFLLQSGKREALWYNSMDFVANF